MRYEVRRMVEMISYIEANSPEEVKRWIGREYASGEALVTKAEIVSPVGVWTIQATGEDVQPLSVTEDEIAILDLSQEFGVPFWED